MGISLLCAQWSMPVDDESDIHDWYVAYTQPQREQLARVNLEVQGFKAHLCELKTIKSLPIGLLETWEPMFPRYIFFRPGHAAQSISAVHSTRGISHVLRFGVVPALLKAEEFRTIRALERGQNQLDEAQASPFQPGVKVRLKNCGLSGLDALVHSVSKKRVTLLIELLGREKKLELKHHQLELVTR